MRAILINPFDRTITETEIEPGLQSLYAALSGPGFPKADPFPTDPAEWADLERDDHRVALIEVIGISDSEDLIFDENGRAADNQACFLFGQWQIVGRCLICGNNDSGDTVSTKWEVGAVAAQVQWQPWDTDYTPDEPVLISFADDIVRRFL